MLAYGFNTGWMPFATTSDNYLSVVSSFLVFVELSFVQAIRAGMMSERLWGVDTFPYINGKRWGWRTIGLAFPSLIACSGVPNG